jgi:hypothetical protein
MKGSCSPISHVVKLLSSRSKALLKDLWLKPYRIHNFSPDGDRKVLVFSNLQTAFMKPIFSRHSDINKMAFMNWRMSDDDSGIRYFINLADGYLSSSIILAKQCLISNSGKQADILIFPILANANHGIELYLKALVWMLNRFLKNETKFEGRHNIDQIFRMVKAKVKQSGGSTELKDFQAGMNELETYINELVQKIEATAGDDKMDFSRYPFTKKSDKHFYVDRFNNVEVDLENFVSRFEIIKEKLSDVSEHFYDLLDEDEVD